VKILVYASLYPNRVWPNHGVFIQERMTRVAQAPGVELRVMAPVPYYPPVPFGWRRAYRGVPRQEIRNGIVVDHPRYGMLPKVSSRFHGDLLFRSTLSTASRIRSEFPFDIIDAHYIYPDAYAATRIGEVLGVPVVSSARGSDINLIGTIPSLRPLVQATLARSRELIAVSSALRNAMVALGSSPDKIHVIPNGVDSVAFRPVPMEAARAKLGLPAGPIVVSVGSLVPNKGFDRMIRALHKIGSIPGQGASLEPTLVILGEGPEAARLERLAKDLGVGARVRFAGSVPHDELAPWYSAADCFCLATEREGWPNSVLEALACGTPVVATAVGGIPEIIRSERVGILVGVSDDEVAAGIASALSRSWDRQEIARFGAGHSWDATARSVLEVFDTALHPKRREARVAS